MASVVLAQIHLNMIEQPSTDRAMLTAVACVWVQDPLICQVCTRLRTDAKTALDIVKIVETGSRNVQPPLGYLSLNEAFGIV